MPRSFKRRFIVEMERLLLAVYDRLDPNRILVSPALYAAIGEIDDEVTRNRTNWHLVAALTGVKSHIVTVEVGRPAEAPFWAEERSGDQPSVYMILDALHHDACARVRQVPSGTTEFIGTPEGIKVRHGEVDTSASPSSRTLRLIARERARIEAGAAADWSPRYPLSVVGIHPTTHGESERHGGRS